MSDKDKIDGTELKYHIQNNINRISELEKKLKYKKKITFDLEEFKIFLKELDDTEYDSGCGGSYDWAENSYYFDEKDNRIKVRRVWHMLDGRIKIDHDFYDDMTIKGNIIYE